MIMNGTRVAYARGAGVQADWDIRPMEEIQTLKSDILKCLNIGLSRLTCRNPGTEGVQCLSEGLICI